jgi:hypothetical protein
MNFPSSSSSPLRSTLSSAIDFGVFCFFCERRRRRRRKKMRRGEKIDRLSTRSLRIRRQRRRRWLRRRRAATTSLRPVRPCAGTRQGEYRVERERARGCARLNCDWIRRDRRWCISGWARDGKWGKRARTPRCQSATQKPTNKTNDGLYTTPTTTPFYIFRRRQRRRHPVVCLFGVVIHYTRVTQQDSFPLNKQIDTHTHIGGGAHIFFYIRFIDPFDT